MKGVKILLVMVAFSLAAVAPILAEDDDLPEGCHIVYIDNNPEIVCDETEPCGIGCPLDDCWGN